MRPAKLSRQSSASTITETEDVEISQQTEYLEKVFDKLKEVTGECRKGSRIGITEFWPTIYILKKLYNCGIYE